jgi:hypothetical protein
MSRLLLWASVGLVAASAVLNGAVELFDVHEGFAEVERLFDVVGERTVQSWFSALTLGAGSVLAAIVAFRLRPRGERHWSRWAVVSAAFLWVSFDETTSIHELLNDPDAPAGLTRFGWVLVAVPVVVALAVWMYPVLRAVSPPIQRLLVASGILYVGGAVGLEVLSGFFVGIDVVYGAIAHGEEFLEMAGVVLFIEAMLRLLQVPRTESGRIVVSPEAGAGAVFDGEDVRPIDPPVPGEA